MMQSYSLMVSFNLIFLACLQKNPSKRMTVKEALMHPWIKKFDSDSMIEKRKLTKQDKESEFEVFTSTNAEKK